MTVFHQTILLCFLRQDPIQIPTAFFLSPLVHTTTHPPLLGSTEIGGLLWFTFPWRSNFPNKLTYHDILPGSNNLPAPLDKISSKFHLKQIFRPVIISKYIYLYPYTWLRLFARLFDVGWVSPLLTGCSTARAHSG